jgi:uncharacterized membrane protein
MDARSSESSVAGWATAVGSLLGAAGCAACALLLGWGLAHHDRLWDGPLVPWGLGLALAAAVAGAAPRAWVDRWLAPRHRHGAAATFLTAFLAVEFVMAWLGYLTFRYYSWDFNLLVDIVQETLRGRFFARPGVVDSFFGQFWFPQAVLWLPLWAAWPDPRVMLLFQIAGYGAMALLVYRLAALRLGPGPWPVALLTAVMLAPSKDLALSMEMGNAPLHAFLVVLAILCVHRGWRTGFALATVAVLVSREFGAALAGALALYAWWHQRWRGLALALIVGAAAWLVVLLAVIMPWLAPERETSFSIYGFGGSPLDVGSVGATRAVVLLHHLLTRSFEGPLDVLTPFGLLPALGMDAWVMLLGLVPNLLAGGYRTRLAYHHAYVGIAVAAVIAIAGARWLDRRLPTTRPAGQRAHLAAVLSVPVTALVLHVTLGYSPLTPAFPWDEYRSTPRTQALWNALGRVPPGVELSGSRHLGTQRAVGRRLGCTWEYVSLRERDGTTTLWCDEWNAPLESPFILVDRPRFSPTLDHLVRRSPYGVVLHGPDVMLLERGADRSVNRQVARWVIGDVAEPARLPRQVGVGVVVYDGTARWGRAVRVPGRRAGLALHGWYAPYCPGLHELTARIRLEPGGRPGPLGRLEVVSGAGTRVVAERSIETSALDVSEYRELTLPFAVTEPLEAEVRLQSAGVRAFRVDGLSVVALDPRTGDPRPPREACEGGRPRS